MFKALDGQTFVLRLVGDDAGQVGVLGEHLLKDVLEAQGVGLGHGKEDGLAGELAGLVLEAHVPDFLPLLAQGVAVGDLAL